MPANRQKNGIKRSPTGYYSFRKQVPEKLRAAWGKREVKVKLETKDEAVALARGAQVLFQFNATAQILMKSLENDASMSSSEVTLIADNRVRDWGIHPEQAPVLRAGYSEAEYDEFKAKEREYIERRDFYFELAGDSLVDEVQQQKDYVSGVWGKAGYQTPYRKPDASTVSGASFNIASGQVETTSSPTIKDALASYLLAYEEKNFGGNVRTLQSAKTNTKRVMTQFAGFIENGRPSVGVQAVGNQRNC